MAITFPVIWENFNYLNYYHLLNLLFLVLPIIKNQIEMQRQYYKNHIMATSN